MARLEPNSFPGVSLNYPRADFVSEGELVVGAPELDAIFYVDVLSDVCSGLTFASGYHSLLK